ncbi:unnamed protein product [Leuciscus chuanchicus]
MFPDSECASTFICGRDKTTYLARFGVAPYLKKELISQANKDAFIIMFDESMNTTTKTKQLDLHIRHGSTDETGTPIVRSRYLGSQFLDHSTAEDLLEHFKLGLQHHHTKHPPVQTNPAPCARLHLSVDHQLPDRQATVSEAGKILIHTFIISTGAPQGCIPSPLLFSLYTNDCTAKDPSVKLLKLAGNTTLIGLIQDGDESAYRLEVEQLAVCIMNSTVEAVESFRFLGASISQDLKWDNLIVKKAHLKKFNLSQELLIQVYSAVTESSALLELSGSAQLSDLRRLQRIVC